MSDKIKKLQETHGANIKIENKYIPTRCYALNLILSGGWGFPRRRIVELFGKEGSGKSTLLYEILHLAHKIEKCVIILVDQETPVPDNRLNKFGLYKGKNLIYIREPSIEAVFIRFNTLISDIEKSFGKDTPIMIGIDSVNAIPPQAHVEAKSVTKLKTGASAQAWGNMLKLWLCNLYFKDLTIFLTNHITETFNTGFGGSFFSGPKTTTPGGRFIKHFESLRVEVKRITLIKNGDVPIGQVTRIKTIKNKDAPPFQEVDIPLFYGNPQLPPGQDYVGSWDDLACFYFLKNKGALKTKGSWSTIDGIDGKFQGENGFVKLLTASPEVKNKIHEIMKALQYSPNIYMHQSWSG